MGRGLCCSVRELLTTGEMFMASRDRLPALLPGTKAIFYYLTSYLTCLHASPLFVITVGWIPAPLDTACVLWGLSFWILPITTHIWNYGHELAKAWHTTLTLASREGQHFEVCTVMLLFTKLSSIISHKPGTLLSASVMNMRKLYQGICKPLIVQLLIFACQSWGTSLSRQSSQLISKN